MTITNLTARLNRVIAQIDKQLQPKTWSILLQAGRELPAHVRIMFAPGDSVVIREIPAGFIDFLDMPEGYTISWVG